MVWVLLSVLCVSGTFLECTPEPIHVYQTLEQCNTARDFYLALKNPTDHTHYKEAACFPKGDYK